MSLRLLYDQYQPILADAVGWDGFVEMMGDLYGTFTKEDYWYGDYDAYKLEKFRALHNIPFIREMMDYQLDKVNDRLYMDKNQLSVSDIGDPRKLSATGSADRLNGMVMSRISSNINRLYRF